MKSLILLTFAAVASLSGCASTDGKQVASADEESYRPTGTYIARKNPTRADVPSLPDKQTLENERQMGTSMQGLGGK